MNSEEVRRGKKDRRERRGWQRKQLEKRGDDGEKSAPSSVRLQLSSKLPALALNASKVLLMRASAELPGCLYLIHWPIFCSYIYLLLLSSHVLEAPDILPVFLVLLLYMICFIAAWWVGFRFEIIRFSKK